MKTVNALFFDFDGTLTDINQREVEAIHDTVNHFGTEVSKAKVRQLCAQVPSHIDVFKKLRVELNDAVVDYWASAFVGRYPLSIVRKGVESTLESLSRKYALLCVTSRETVAEVIQELGFLRLDGFFTHVVTRDVAAKHFGLTLLPFFPFHEHRRKLYQYALALAECSPKRATVIGDMGRELEPAKKMGIRTIGLITCKARRNELQRASDSLISRITQLRKVLLGSNKP